MKRETSELKRALKHKLKSTISHLREKDGIDAEIKLSLYRISDGLEVTVNGYQMGWAASIIKVPVMIATLQDVEKRNLSLDTLLEVNHKFTLEPFDYISMLPNGSLISVRDLLHYMIVQSDNEATNMLANTISIDKINDSIRELGLKRTMLGHLLCYNAPRYSSDFNRDGSNVTCPKDMVNLMRHIYDAGFSKLSPEVRNMADAIMSSTSSAYLKQRDFAGKRIK